MTRVTSNMERAKCASSN